MYFQRLRGNTQTHTHTHTHKLTSAYALGLTTHVRSYKIIAIDIHLAY